MLGSNQRPPACRAGALPTELTARGPRGYQGVIALRAREAPGANRGGTQFAVAGTAADDGLMPSPREATCNLSHASDSPWSQHAGDRGHPTLDHSRVPNQGDDRNGTGGRALSGARAESSSLRRSLRRADGWRLRNGSVPQVCAMPAEGRVGARRSCAGDGRAPATDASGQETPTPTCATLRNSRPATASATSSGNSILWRQGGGGLPLLLLRHRKEGRGGAPELGPVAGAAAVDRPSLSRLTQALAAGWANCASAGSCGGWRPTSSLPQLRRDPSGCGGEAGRPEGAGDRRAEGPSCAAVAGTES